MLSIGWLEAGEYLEGDDDDRCQVVTDPALADVVFFVQNQAKPILPHQRRAVLNLEAHTFDRAHLDETDVSLSYHLAESDVPLTYGFVLRPFLRSHNASAFDAWCCGAASCDDDAALLLLLCSLRELDAFLPRMLLLQPSAAKPAIMASMMVVFVSATCERHGSFIWTMMNLVPTDSFGACFRNRDDESAAVARIAPLLKPHVHDLRDFRKAWIASHYRFYLSVENTILEDYVTEKFYLGFKLERTLMVYLGAPNAAAYAPAPHSFIHVNAFGTIAALVAHMHELNRDPMRFEAYFEWRRRNTTNNDGAEALAGFQARVMERALTQAGPKGFVRRTCEFLRHGCAS